MSSTRTEEIIKQLQEGRTPDAWPTWQKVAFISNEEHEEKIDMTQRDLWVWGNPFRLDGETIMQVYGKGDAAMAGYIGLVYLTNVIIPDHKKEKNSFNLFGLNDLTVELDKEIRHEPYPPVVVVSELANMQPRLYTAETSEKWREQAFAEVFVNLALDLRPAKDGWMK